MDRNWSILDAPNSFTMIARYDFPQWMISCGGNLPRMLTFKSLSSLPYAQCHNCRKAWFVVLDRFSNSSRYTRQGSWEAFVESIAGLWEHSTWQMEGKRTIRIAANSQERIWEAFEQQPWGISFPQKPFSDKGSGCRPAERQGRALLSGIGSIQTLLLHDAAYCSQRRRLSQDLKPEMTPTSCDLMWLYIWFLSICQLWM